MLSNLVKAKQLKLYASRVSNYTPLVLRKNFQLAI